MRCLSSRTHCSNITSELQWRLGINQSRVSDSSLYQIYPSISDKGRLYWMRSSLRVATAVSPCPIKTARRLTESPFLRASLCSLQSDQKHLQRCFTFCSVCCVFVYVCVCQGGGFVCGSPPSACNSE